MSSNTKNLTLGGQVTLYNLRMFFQVNSKIGKWAICLWLMIAALITWCILSKDALYNGIFYWYAKGMYSLGDTSHVYTMHYNGHPVYNTTGQAIVQPYFQMVGHGLWHVALIALIASTQVTLGLLMG